MKRRLVGILLAGVASPALADNLDIKSIINTPVQTSKASNNSPGNVTIEFGAGISVTNPGAALTLDSPNSIDNLGTIQNAGQGGIAVHIVGGLTGSFLSEGQVGSIINANGGGTGNVGVLLDGASAFTGDINLGTGTQMIVTGTNAVGVAIRAPLNGTLTMGAGASVTGENAIGLLVVAPVSGSVSLTEGISVAGTNTFTVDKVDPLAGSAVAIGASVAGGILNAGAAVDNDSTISSALSNSGTAPTFAIQPSIAGAGASNVAIGLLTDATNPNLSFINRGTIHATENDPGISTVAVQIGETGAAAHTVTLTGGIYNRGSITAQAQTNNTFATSVPGASANATGILIGNGAFINAGAASPEALLNGGSITTSVGGDQPGISTGVLIQNGGVLPSFTNTGAIDALAATTDTKIASLSAYGVRDLSGTLTTLKNSGRISVQVTPLDNGTQAAVAVDLSHSAANETFTNSNTVIGDIIFGSAGMNGAIAGNQLVIEGANPTNQQCPVACVRGNVSAVGGGRIDVHVSENGIGGAFRTSKSALASLTVGSAGTVELALNKGSLGSPVIATTGATVFGTGSKMLIIPSTFLPDSGIYTLIHSNASLTFTDFAAATAQPIPFIFNGAINHDANNLTLALQRKTASQLGLVANDAAIYEPLADAALGDDQFGSYLLTLNSASEVQTVVNASVPDIAGGARALAVAMTDQATGVVGSRQRGLITAPPNTRNDFRFWAQEFYNNVSASGTSTVAGYSGAGQGIALGVEWGALSTGRYGVGYTFFSGESTESHPRDTKTNGDWNMVSGYAAWRAGDFFFTPQVSIGNGAFQSRRTIVFGNYGSNGATLNCAIQSLCATGKWSGYLGAGGLTAGYIVDVAGFQIMPQISLDGLYLRESTYTEVGAGGIGVSLKDQAQQSVRTFAGVLGSGTYTWDNGNLQPQILVGWSHEFLNSPSTIDGSFESTPGSPFHLVGPTLEPNKIIGGASFAYVFGNWAAGLNYDATQSSGSLAQSATVSLSSRF